MNIFDLILTRRTVHSYKNKSVPSDIIEKAILCAIHAPNHKLTWPWKFIMLGPKSREKLAALSAQLKAKKNGVHPTQLEIEASTKKFLEPGALLAVAIKKSESPTQMREDYASLACALQNMALFLWNEGYGSKWSTGGATMHEETYKIAELSTLDFELCGLFWIGEAAMLPKAQARPNLSQFLSSVE